MKRYAKTQYAFTFVETLLGFLIFSIVALVLYSTFFSGLKIQQRSHDDTAMYHEVKMALDMMGRELEQAMAFDFSKMSSDLKDFEPTAQSISFLMADRHGAIKRISYYLEDKDRVQIFKTLIGEHYQNNVSVVNVKQEQIPSVVLMRREEPFADFIAGAHTSHERQEVLLDHVEPKSFRFLYALGLAEDKTSLAWQETWDKEYIPAFIRLEMTLIPSQPKEKPLMIKKDIYIPTGSWEETSS